MSMLPSMLITNVRHVFKLCTKYQTFYRQNMTALDSTSYGQCACFQLFYIIFSLSCVLFVGDQYCPGFLKSLTP